jgi:4-carboxymuconolactone decarboxylase
MPAKKKRNDRKADSRKADSGKTESRYEAGLAIRRRVLGEAHVARAFANATDFDRDYQDFITRYAWGGVWTRPGLDTKTRSLLTIAILAALGREQVLKLHVRATRNTGVSPAEVSEALMHVAIYAGVPAADAAIKIAKATLEEMARER